MKIAFAHCRILPGGALMVLEDLIKEEVKNNYELWIMSYELKIFTLFSDRKQLDIENRKIKIVTALPGRLNQLFLYFSKNKVLLLSWLLDYRNLIFFYPCLMKILSRKIRKFKPNKIVISSFAVAKNISVDNVYKKLYIHSPMQYIRDNYDEYISKLKWIKLNLFQFIAPRLRKWDLKFKKFDEIYCNSKYTQKLVKKIYWLESKVQYPKIWKEFFDSWIANEHLDYYVYTGRLVNFIRETDKVIHLFNKTWLPLIVMWSGPDENYLKSIAKANIVFVWWIDDVNEQIKILKNAKWLINLTKESFGIATLQALLLWVPVFGYDGGATPELVHEDSWILVDRKDMNTLISWFKKFESHKFDRKKIAKITREKFINLYSTAQKIS